MAEYTLTPVEGYRSPPKNFEPISLDLDAPQISYSNWSANNVSENSSLPSYRSSNAPHPDDSKDLSKWNCTDQSAGHGGKYESTKLGSRIFGSRWDTSYISKSFSS